MALPGNGIFVVKGEMSIIMTAMRRGARWSSHSHQDEDVDGLMKKFQELKELLNKIDDLRLIEPNIYLAPFLDVIRSEETTGPVTSLALSAVNKFLSYGLIDPTHSNVPLTVHNIADAITHARFVGTDQSSDGVVLMRILQVLRTLTLAPEGSTLTNESLCEIMLSCFRISFETSLNELLRRTAEHYLKDMVQLVFMRLPQFSEDLRAIKHFKMKSAGTIEQTTKSNRRNKNRRSSFNRLISNKTNLENNEIAGGIVDENESPSNNLKPIKNLRNANHLSTTPMTPSDNIVDIQGSISQDTPHSSEIECCAPPPQPPTPLQSVDGDVMSSNIDINIESPGTVEDNLEVSSQQLQQQDVGNSPIEINNENINQDYINERGIRFTQQIQDDLSLIPYGLASVRELFRFLITLCNPLDKHNTDIMIHLGLTLLTVAFEVGADSIGKYSTLLLLVKDDLCRNLFTLLNNERLSVFATNLQLSFLIFESLRTHLKYQLEFYLIKLIDIISSDSGKISYEHKELALDNIIQLWRIPGLVTELYLNYDCNLYCTNLYEDLTKLLAKNAFSATQGVYHTHLLSLDALLTVIENIEMNCTNRIKNQTTNHLINTIIIKENENIQNLISDNRHINQRLKFSENLPKKSDLLALKNIKKWLPTGTEHFNHKPKKGIQFLQEHGVLKSELDPIEIALFLKENSALDKKVIGEYISNRSNLHILDAFVKTFDFTNMRIDQALRHYLETFRLPGEAPTISLLLEHFAEHWHKSNGEPFADVDSAFTLAYAVIMLNVDQHNQNAKKQTIPMSPESFKKNLKGVNGGNDFDEEMLDEIYNAIKNDEIVMPAEQTGIVRDNYLWKVLLRKGTSKDGQYYHISDNSYDYELFTIIWGPIIAALSFIYDKTDDELIYKKTIFGFEKLAYISSNYNLIKNLDILILTLCKFTTFHNLNQQQQQNQQIGSNKTNNIINFANNIKARLALKTLFNLCYQYGDNIREGWKNLFNLILNLYIENLLTKSLIEVDDFIELNGKIQLVYKENENYNQKPDTNNSLFSSLYSYMLSSENLTKLPNNEEQQLIDLAKGTIKECNIELILNDSKFLHDESLKELVKTLIELSHGPDLQKQQLNNLYNENVTVFFLELLIKILIQNRDRVMIIWQNVRDHIYTLVMNSSLFDYQFLLERSVIGLLRIAIRLMRNEEMSPIVIQSLKMLLLLKTSTLNRISRQISFGLYELLKTSAQNIHTNADWTIIFTLLECVGAGAQQPKPIVDDNLQNEQCTKSDGETPIASDDDLNTDRGYTSDSELTNKSPKHTNIQRSTSPVVTSPLRTQNTGGGWILVGNSGEIQSPVIGRIGPASQYSLALDIKLGSHDPSSLIKCCESLAFLVRDVAHITPYNFDNCVHCIRTFVEANLHGSKRLKKREKRYVHHRKSGNSIRKRGSDSRRSPVSSNEDEEDSDDENLPSGYQQISIQLLDLMHTLHTRTAQIFRWWAEEGGEIAQETSLWTQGWCPLLQGIARLCCDVRKEVRMSALTYLQRALLVHDLQTLNGQEWEECFHRVLFPLLSYLLQPISPIKDKIAMEETRMRAATLLSKVFLHHLTPLLTLNTFVNLWLIILDFMDKYMHADKSDLLYEAIPESLKNMLLVMDSAKVFDTIDGKNHLWDITWERINKFLPNMKNELFKEIEQEVEQTKQFQQQNSNEDLKIIQHSIENATRSSIILQPPPVQQVSSHLFAHLGQMVSTPITQVQSNIAPNSTSSSSILQPTLPTSMPYMPNLFNQSTTTNPFPILYNTSPIITTASPTEVQPASLYSEYLGNPYNVQQSIPASTSQQQDQTSSTLDNNLNNRIDNDMKEDDKNLNNTTTFFQSSNYFQTDNSACNFPGSEILFGSNNEPNNTLNIPLCTASINSDIKSSN